MDTLEKHFEAAMFDIYTRAKEEANYTASIFLQMLGDEGGVRTAKKLINAPNPSVGYTALWERDCLHLTVEAVVVGDARWHSLFDPSEIERAGRRLKQYGYQRRS